MSKLIFDTQINSLLIPYISAGDVALSVIVDPPADLPNFRKANCAVLDSANATLTKYDSSGVPVTTIDLSEVSDELEKTVTDLKADVRSNTGEINVLIGVTAATDTALAATDLLVAKDGKQIRKNRRHIDEVYPVVFDTEEIAKSAKRMAESADVRSKQNADVFSEYATENDKNISSLQQNTYSQAHRLDLVENKSSKNKTLIDSNRILINEDLEPRLAANEGLSGENESSIIELQSDMQTTKPKAENADTLSKSNEKNIETLGGAIDGLNSLIDDNTADIGTNKSSIESLEKVAVKEGGDPVFATVTSELVKTSIIESDLTLNLKVGGNTLVGVYGDYVSLAGASFATCNMRPKLSRRSGDIVTWGVLQETIPEGLHIQHGDDAVLNSLDMGHNDTPGFIKNLKDAELDGDAVNFGQLKEMLDSIFTSDIDFNNHTLKNVKTINGKNDLSLEINRVKKIRSHSNNNEKESVEFVTDGINFKAKNFHFIDDEDNDKLVIGENHIHFKHKDVQFHEKVSFDKETTFGTNAPVNINNALNLHGHSISNVRTADNDNKATNLGHIKQLISEMSSEGSNDVLSVDDLNWTPRSGKPFTNTSLLIEAMPNNSIVIGQHNKTNNPDYAKYNIVNKGGGENLEPQPMIYQICKNTSGEATGIATAYNGSQTITRVLHSVNKAWTAISTTSGYSLPENEIADSPENQIYFTQDQGIVVSELDEGGSTVLKPISGYNTPKVTQDLEELKADNELGKSRTEYFKNKNKLSFDYSDADHAPLVDCYVLATNETLTGSSIEVTDDTTYKYSGTYNTVGVFAISSGIWTVKYALHNAYKHESENYYIAFDLDILKWIIIEPEHIHSEINQSVGDDYVELGGRSSLPETHNGYIIDINFKDLESLHFNQADNSVVRLDNQNKKIIIDFGTAVVSGFLVIK